MDAAKLTYQILGQKLLTWYDSKILVDWAMKLMGNGFESESLIILAGLDYSDKEERERYFWKAIKELEINVDKNETDLIQFYVDNLVEEVLSGNISPKYALKQMSDVASTTEYRQRYRSFYLLDDDVESLKYDGQTFFSNGLNRENANEFILDEFKRFKKILNGDYSDYFDKAFCNSCRQIMIPKLITKYQFKFPFTKQALICEYCKSQDIETFSSETGREVIINILS